MSSIAIQTSARRIEPGASADAQPSHHACRACRIGRRRRGFGWTRDAMRKPSRQSSDQRREEPGKLDVKPCAHHLPDHERFSQQRQVVRGVISAHTTPSTLRQQRAADRFRFGNRPEGGGNTPGTPCRRPLAGVRLMSAGLGAGLRHTPADLGAGRRWFATLREPTDGLQNESQAVAFLPTSRARCAVLLSAMCTQRALLRKTEGVRCTTRDVTRRFESPRSVLNVPASGKEGTDD